MGLAEHAARAAGRPVQDVELPDGEAPPGASAAPGTAPEPLGRPEVPEQTSDDPKPVPVVVALLRAIRDLGYVRKTGKFEQGNTKYSYRSVDAVVNAANVVMERHGILFVPEVLEQAERLGKTGSGSTMTTATVRTRWHIAGPAGDVFPVPVVTVGHAFDTSDKAFNKAQSVAWRIALVQVFQMVTGDPDPDAVRIERGESKFDPIAVRDEALHPDTSVARLNQLIHDMRSTNHGHEMVQNETGSDEKVGSLVIRIRKERAGG